MYVALTILILLICVLLGVIVLIQNPKGGGLSSTFGQAGNQLLGFQRSTDIVEKWTWGLLIALFSLTLMTSAFVDRGGVAQPTGVQGADPSRVFTTPAAAPTLELPAPADAPE